MTILRREPPTTSPSAGTRNHAEPYAPSLSAGTPYYAEPIPETQEFQFRASLGEVSDFLTHRIQKEVEQRLLRKGIAIASAIFVIVSGGGYFVVDRMGVSQNADVVGTSGAILPQAASGSADDASQPGRAISSRLDAAEEGVQRLAVDLAVLRLLLSLQTDSGVDASAQAGPSSEAPPLWEQDGGVQ